MIVLQTATGKLILLFTLFLAGIVLQVMRTPESFFFPPNVGDDIAMVEYIFNTPSDWLFYMTDRHYVTALPQLLGRIFITYFPLDWLPHLFAATSIGLLVAVWMLPLLPAFHRRLNLSFGLGLIVTLWWFMLPAGSRALISYLVFTNWTLLLLLCLLSLLPPPQKPALALARAAAMVLAIWTHPLGFLVIPINLLHLWRGYQNGQQGALLPELAVLLSALLYMAFGMQHGAQRALPVSAGWLLEMSYRSLYFLADRVIAETLLGYHLRLQLSSWVVLVFAAGVSIALAAAAWRNRLHGEAALVALLLLYWIGAITFFSLIGRDDYNPMLLSNFAFRYCYVQKYLFVLVLCVVFKPQLETLFAKRFTGLLFACYLITLHTANTAQYRDTAISPAMQQFVADFSKHCHIKSAKPFQSYGWYAAYGRRWAAFLGELEAARTAGKSGTYRFDNGCNQYFSFTLK